MNKSKLNSLSVEQILKGYEFSHRFYVTFACTVAREAIKVSKLKDPRSLAGIEAAMDYINGKISKEAMDAAANAANYATYAANYAAYAAANAATYATYAAANYAAANYAAATYATNYAANAAANYAACAAACAANAAANYAAANYAAAKDFNKKVLMNMIMDLSLVESILLGIEV